MKKNQTASPLLSFSYYTKLTFLLLGGFIFIAYDTIEAQVVATDRASSYTEWNSRTSRGRGFAPWSVWTLNSDGNPGMAGHLIGSSTPTHGDINTNNKAFGMFAFPQKPSRQARANAQRGFRYYYAGQFNTLLQDHHTFSMDVAVNETNGSKGVEILAADFTAPLRFKVENGNYLINDVVLDWAFDPFSVVYFEVTQLGNNNMLTRVTRGSDVWGPFLINTNGRMTAFRAYVLNTEEGEENFLYFNSLEVRVDNSLPVELLYFEGERIERIAQLRWGTASEENNEYFAIERSVDGIVFEEIGKVAGNGNTQLTNEYTYRDKNPMKGMNYYRLTQVDFDGMEHTHDVVKIYFPEDEYEISILPNPAIRDLYINLGTPSQKDRPVFLTTMDGKIVNRSIFPAGRYDHTLDVSQLPAGMYILQLVEEGQKPFSKMIMVGK